MYTNVMKSSAWLGVGVYGHTEYKQTQIGERVRKNEGAVRYGVETEFSAQLHI